MKQFFLLFREYYARCILSKKECASTRLVLRRMLEQVNLQNMEMQLPLRLCLQLVVFEDLRVSLDMHETDRSNCLCLAVPLITFQSSSHFAISIARLYDVSFVMSFLSTNNCDFYLYFTPFIIQRNWYDSQTFSFSTFC